MQVQVLCDPLIKPPDFSDTDTTGFDLMASCDVTIGANAVGTVNLGFSVMPTRGASIRVITKGKHDQRGWQLAGSSLGVDVTGEALVVIKNETDGQLIIAQGTKIGAMIVES